MKYYVEFTINNKDQFEGRISHNDIWEMYGDESIEAESPEDAIRYCIEHLIENADNDETVWLNTNETNRIELGSYTKYTIVINNEDVVFVDNDDDREIVIKHGMSDWSIYYKNDNDEYNDDDISVLCYSFRAEQAEEDDGE